MDTFRLQFSEINKLAVKIDSGVEENEVKSPTLQGVTSDQVRAKLPIIALPEFTGNILDWLAFSDLFISLVHDRNNISDSEKHYYLRASVSGEALSIIRHIPMDGQNYEVAFNLLRQRYNNVRLLTDSYLDRILKLPVLSELSNIRQNLYDPLRESTQALQKLKLPVSEWSYLLLFITLQKLPTRVRTLFEERHGKDSNTLPTFSQLMEFLDEQCRLQLTMTDAVHRQQPQADPVRQRGGIQRPPTYQRRVVAAVPAASTSARSNQVNRCIYCSGLDHSLYRCPQFLKISPKVRKNWTIETGLCFRCLRNHLSRDCQQRNWCKHCGQENHNTLLCHQDSRQGETRSDWQRPSSNQRPNSSSDKVQADTRRRDGLSRRNILYLR